ncbi:hypothetical protein KDA_64470 [Dictyobacter alpinus]|uniref:Glycoside hydrolase family 42 N-terminal domain-containing protein n=1 Tax=Dictyobacter alpinus TaxID=2014873 RepID=A0A402BHW2_9CHLR|nr:hypothetical protein [Dictyobacter alpinus]GCE30963.1 hypothetical protein KDA_64470 [Dictyobacter alpinus]
MAATSFRHRVLLNWINDISTIARRGKRWPIIDLDEQTLHDYRELFSVIKRWGFDTVAIWGLFISHSWNPDIKHSISEKRKHDIRELIDTAHAQGIRVLGGLGLYSWGFEEIIRTYPEVAKEEGRFWWGNFVSDNGVAMCYSTELAKVWQRNVIDFMGNFGLDGFEMQSADQGRCACHECRKMGEMEYHAAVNAEFGAYIRAKWPAMTIAVSGWGMSFRDETDIPYLRKMSAPLDYMIDVTDQSITGSRPIRKQLIQSLESSFGSLGGTILVPPQRWDRLRWFLPHAELSRNHIASLAADGGNAFEFFAGPLVNPQYEMMTKFVGTILTQPTMSTHEGLALVVEDMFAPRNAGVREDLVQLFLQAETDYFSRIEPVSGEFDFEPLIGEEAGPAIYLDRLPGDTLRQYRQDLRKWREAFAQTIKEINKIETGIKVVQCIGAILEDIDERMTFHSIL